MNSDLIALRTGEISVNGRHGSIAILWAFRLLASTLVAFQFSYAVHATGVGSLPGGDIVLFEPGGLHLLEVARIGGSYLFGALKTALTLLAVLSLIELIPLAALYVSLSHRAPLGIADWWGRALQHFPAFFMLAGITLLSQAAWLLAASISWTAVGTALVHKGERLPTIVGAVWLCVALFVAASMGAVLDVCRAAAVRKELGGKDALFAGISLLRERAPAVLFGWVPAGFAAICVVVAAGLIVHRIDVSQGGLGRVAGVFVVHQLAALGVCYARAAWLVNALRLVRRG